MVPIKVTERVIPQANYENLVQQGVNPFLARLWAARGIQQAPSFELNSLLSPKDLKDIDKASEILFHAINNKKKLLVVADYDCDGATACAVALRGLRMMGADIDFFVPNRFETGYGLSAAVINLILEQYPYQPDLIITVDNGIASFDGIKRAKEVGIDVLVTDHHLPSSSLPDALAIVNPNQANCSFASKSLAGCGVIFYVLIALRAKFRQEGVYTAENQPNIASLLDMVALGTVADVVKLDQNNRILVSYGLKLMRNNKAHEGIKALFKVSGANISQASASDLGFFLGPRINAAGRLADMEIGIRLLTTDDPETAMTLAMELNDFNRERKQIEDSIRVEAESSLEHINEDRPSIVSFGQDWHEGVIGIVASRLKEKYWKPTIVFAPSEHGFYKGSARSIPDVHIRDVLDLVSKRHPDIIISFGGHAMAAGVSIKKDTLAIFHQALDEAVIELTGKTNFEPTVETDGGLPTELSCFENAKLISEQVWGSGFPAPIFFDEFQVIQQTLLKEKHLKAKLEKNGMVFDAVWFNHQEALPNPVKLVYEFQPNEWNNWQGTQLMIRYQV
ncbi:single-stranded-DNA-specific exonuclease RecJ [Basilea psittacipulmonis]|uniref:Single-stranded-DNA-specific exonuclease RecJ n=1 Tax=Basilea psittacipulmonis DSM 24701 TaxID=1072685 RepID=A0A077DGE8_9BURK|nr:single-stranded-DNA-specific exonuclease RecJ [Basilea psittacipulmonis]AIL32552.1 single-stranded DNA exonuclease [Basilea psittacipulmonis DSM 24701]